MLPAQSTHIYRLIVLCLTVWTAGFWVVSDVAAQQDGPPKPLIRCWTYQTGEIGIEQVASDNDSVYLLRVDGNLESISTSDGSRNWAAPLGGSVVSDLMIANGRIFAATRPSDTGHAAKQVTLRSISAETGVTSWAAKLPYSEKLYLLTVGGRVAAVSAEGGIFALDPVSGSTVWTHNLRATVAAAPTLGGSAMFAALVDGRTVRVGSEAGEASVSKRTGFEPVTIFAGKEGLFGGDDRGNIYVTNDSGEIVWKYKAGGRITDISQLGEDVLAASNDNFLYAFSADRGNVNWKRRQPGRLAGKPLVFSNMIVTVTVGESATLILDPENGKPINLVTLDDENVFTAAPVAAGALVVFPTQRGLAAFGQNGCGEQIEKAARN